MLKETPSLDNRAWNPVHRTAMNSSVVVVRGKIAWMDIDTGKMLFVVGKNTSDRKFKVKICIQSYVSVYNHSRFHIYNHEVNGGKGWSWG